MGPKAHALAQTLQYVHLFKIKVHCGAQSIYNINIYERETHKEIRFFLN